MLVLSAMIRIVMLFVRDPLWNTVVVATLALVVITSPMSSRLDRKMMVGFKVKSYKMVECCDLPSCCTNEKSNGDSISQCTSFNATNFEGKRTTGQIA